MKHCKMKAQLIAGNARSTSALSTSVVACNFRLFPLVEFQPACAQHISYSHPSALIASLNILRALLVRGGAA